MRRNHDGSLERAKLLIRLAKEAGGGCGEVPNFQATQIVSDYGFAHMKRTVSHQASWKKSVTEVYAEASVPLTGQPILKEAVMRRGIRLFLFPLRF